MIAYPSGGSGFHAQACKMKSKEQSLRANETGELIFLSVLGAIHNGASFQSKALTSNFSETGNFGGLNNT